MAEKLAQVRDSVALSDRMSAVYYDVARDGTVSRFSEYDYRMQQQTVVCRLKCSDDDWGWRGGWLPILMIGEQYELFAGGDQLYWRDGNIYRVYPENRVISREEFETAAAGIAAYWHNWFAAGRVLPDTGTRLDDAWRSSLIQALCIFSGRYPRYGAHYYRLRYHNSFPPNVLSMSETLLQFGHFQEAEEVYCFYFERFVKDDGSIVYYGPSLSEYGGLLWLGAKLMAEIPGSARRILMVLKPLLRYVLNLFDERYTRGSDFSEFVMLSGSPEADESSKIEPYFHNNYQILRGLHMLVPEISAAGELELAWEVQESADLLRNMLHDALLMKKQEIGGIPFSLDQRELNKDIQSCRETVYANYRYYPELLEAAYLAPEDAAMCISYRENCGGEYHGMTLFTRMITGQKETDQWPIASYARALLEYGEKERFMRLLAAHFNHYISSDTFTAYEQVANFGSPRRSMMPSCTPVQLVLPRLLGWSWSYRKWDGSIVELGGPDLARFS